MEYYGEFGPIHHLLPAVGRAHDLYAAADVESKRLDPNFGIGRGVTGASDQWAAKAIFSFACD